MALQGSLEDFSLAEILQLIALQKKSGVLRLTSPEASGVLFFERGVIVSVTDRREKKSDPLLEHLVHTKRLLLKNPCLLCNVESRALKVQSMEITDNTVPGKSSLWMRVAYVAFVLFFILGGSVVWRFCIILSWSLPGFYQFFGGWFNPLGVVSLGVAWYMTALVIWLFGRRRKSVHIPALDALLLAFYGTVGLAIIQTIFVFSFSIIFKRSLFSTLLFTVLVGYIVVMC